MLSEMRAHGVREFGLVLVGAFVIDNLARMCPCTRSGHVSFRRNTNIIRSTGTNYQSIFGENLDSSRVPQGSISKVDGRSCLRPVSILIKNGHFNRVEGHLGRIDWRDEEVSLNLLVHGVRNELLARRFESVVSTRTMLLHCFSVPPVTFFALFNNDPAIVLFKHVGGNKRKVRIIDVKMLSLSLRPGTGCDMMTTEEGTDLKTMAEKL